jgi:hypothetical protein
MRKILNATVNFSLVICIILMLSAIGLTIARTMDSGDTIKELNKQYVFVYPADVELPEGVNLCVDVIKPGLVRDTVWLMPDHESAGY